MKKFIAVGAIFALTLTGCSREVQVDNPPTFDAQATGYGQPVQESATPSENPYDRDKARVLCEEKAEDLYEAVYEEIPSPYPDGHVKNGWRDLVTYTYELQSEEDPEFRGPGTYVMPVTLMRTRTGDVIKAECVVVGLNTTAQTVTYRGVEND